MRCRESRVTGHLTDGSRGSRGEKCDRLSSLRPGGLQTAPVARAHRAPERSRTVHQSLADRDPRDKAVQRSPQRICRLLAVRDDTQRQPQLVGNDRVGD